MLDFEAKKIALEEEAEKFENGERTDAENLCFFLPSGEVKLRGGFGNMVVFFQ